MAWWKMCVPKNQGGMGFRDIHCFNLAMLAKQAWRLLENPDSLCATILRVKYYPDGDLLNTDLKKGSSFTWQSIMAGVSSLKRGHIWRVGNGQNIDIWEDAWIPNCANRKIVTPKGGQLLRKVADLIDPILNSWDEDLLRQTLWPIDVQRVLTIPISQHDMPDFIAWNFTKKGSFRFGLLILWNGTTNMGTSYDIPMGWDVPRSILFGRGFGNLLVQQRLKYLFGVHFTTLFRVVLT